MRLGSVLVDGGSEIHLLCQYRTWYHLALGM